MKTFWIVAKASCQLNSTIRHDSFELAKEECERLAEKERRTFLVFRCVGKCGTLQPAVEWQEVE